MRMPDRFPELLGKIFNEHREGLRQALPREGFEGDQANRLLARAHQAEARAS